MASSRKTTSGGVRKATSRVPTSRAAVHETGKRVKAVPSGKGKSGRTNTTARGMQPSTKSKSTPSIGKQGGAVNASVKGKAGNTAYPAGSNKSKSYNGAPDGKSSPRMVSGGVNNTGSGYTSSQGILKRHVPSASPSTGKAKVNNTGSGYQRSGKPTARHNAGTVRATLKKGGSVHNTGSGYTSHGPTVKRHKASNPS